MALPAPQITASVPTYPCVLHSLFNLSYILLICMCSFLCMCKCAMVPLWQSEDNLLESIFSSHVDSGDQTRAIRLGSRPLPTEPSHWPLRLLYSLAEGRYFPVGNFAFHLPEESFSFRYSSKILPHPPQIQCSAPSPTYTPLPSSFLGSPLARQQCSRVPHIALY